MSKFFFLAFFAALVSGCSVTTSDPQIVRGFETISFPKAISGPIVKTCADKAYFLRKPKNPGPAIHLNRELTIYHQSLVISGAEFMKPFAQRFAVYTSGATPEARKKQSRGFGCVVYRSNGALQVGESFAVKANRISQSDIAAATGGTIRKIRRGQ